MTSASVKRLAQINEKIITKKQQYLGGLLQDVRVLLGTRYRVVAI